MQTFYDLFAGIGGFRLGLERAGFRCVGGAEIDRTARQIYARNFGEEPGHRDITKVEARDIPDHDVLCAGFPCPSFSTAGKRRGLADPRGELFFEIVRIAREKQPRYLLLENVKGLLNHEGGRTFAIMLLALHEIGYAVEWQLVNGRYFLPQSRERVFILGHLGSKPVRPVFPLGDYGGMAGEVEKAPAVRCLTSGDLHSQMTVISTDAPSVSRPERGIVNTIDASYAKGPTKHGDRSIIRVESALIQSRGLETRQDGLAHAIKGGAGGSSRNHLAIYQRKRGFNQGGLHNDIAPTLSANSWEQNNLIVGVQYRRFTPLECERLQGFPDGWTSQCVAEKGDMVFSGEWTEALVAKGGKWQTVYRPKMMTAPVDGVYPVADTPRYRCIGNAVMPPVIEYIARALAA